MMLLATCLLTTAAWADPGTKLSLDEALAKARIAHPGLRASRAETTAAHAQVGEAFSGYLPRVDTYVQYQRSTANWLPTPWMVGLVQGASAERDNRLGFSDTVNYVTFGTVLTQPIHDFGRTGSRVDSARARDSVARASLRATEQDIELGVRVAFYDVLAAQQAVLVARETRQNQARHVERTRHFVDVGRRTKYDLLSAELKLDEADLAVLHSQRVLRTARVKLNNAMGLDEDTEYEATEPPPDDASLERQALADLMRTAETSRPELARSVAQSAMRRADRSSARAGYFPELLAVGSLSGAKVDEFNVGLNWYAGIGLTWRVFDGLLTYQRSEATAALINASEAKHERLRQSIRAEIQIQMLSVDEAKKRLKVAERAVETAKERLRVADGMYGAGTSSVLDLEDAQVAHTNTRLQWVQARHDLSVARVLLGRAVGR
jgi:outer membrane protein TolC